VLDGPSVKLNLMALALAHSIWIITVVKIVSGWYQERNRICLAIKPAAGA
jgi:hypothetical protein